MTDTPGESGGNPLQPPPSITSPEERIPGAKGGARKPRQRPLIPRKYQGFIPLAVVLLAMVAFYLGPLLFPEGTGDSVQEPSPTVTLSGSETPPSPTASFPWPTGAATQVTAAATASLTPSGSPYFTLTTSPTSASAGRGETVTYTMVIDGKNGFSSPVTLELTASALFVSRTYDFGTYDPPFPRTIPYPFTVPDYLPSGVTVDGTLKATSGDLVHENRLTLRVE